MVAIKSFILSVISHDKFEIPVSTGFDQVGHWIYEAGVQVGSLG